MRAAFAGPVAAVLLVAAAAVKLTAAEPPPQWPSPGRSWSIAELPVGKNPPAGFTATVKVGADEQVGYVPVEITVKAAGGLTADRQLLVRIEPTPGGHAPPINGIPADLPIRVAEGTRSATFTRFVPKPSLGNAFDVSILEQGAELPGYRADLGQLIRNAEETFARFLNREHQTEFAVIGNASPGSTDGPSALRTLITASFGRGEMLPPPQGPLDSLTLSQLQQTGLLTFLDPSSLPDDWRHYQLFDAVIVDRSQIDPLSSNERKQLAGLRDWVLCGGTVVVLNAEGPQWFEKALGMAPGSALPETEQRALATHCETVVTSWIQQFESLSEQLRSGSQLLRRTEFGVSSYLMLEPRSREKVAQYASYFETELGDRQPDWHRSVWKNQVGAGQAIGIRPSDDGSSPSALQWLLVQRLIGHRQSTVLRRGFEPMLGDRRFLEWLIPGVAEPPVYTFMGLLAGFVILVGPVAYRQTTRRGRGYLMFAIAPALALVTTTSMFIYGTLADGFGTHARVRQLTWIDGASGDAAERVRSAYFAGIRPGDGLSFPEDAEVFEYRHSSVNYDPQLRHWQRLSEQSPGRLGRVLIDREQQVFDSSFLPSREQRQFVAYRPRRGVGQLILHRSEGADASESPRAENTLSIGLRDVVIRDQQGEYWYVPSLAASATAEEVTGLDARGASSALGDLYNLQRPIDQGGNGTRRNRGSRTGFGDLATHLNRDLSTGRTATEGVFESWLREHLQLSGKLPRGSFVALADVGAEAVAVPTAELTESIHYVFGTLP